MTELDHLPVSERMTFRRWRPSDEPLASALWRDDVVMRYLGGPYSDDQVSQRLQREIANQASFGVQYWPLLLATTGEHVGCCGLKPHVPEQQLYELGFHLLPSGRARIIRGASQVSAG